MPYNKLDWNLVSNASIQYAIDWLDFYGVNTDYSSGVSLESITKYLEANPGASLEDVKRLSPTNSSALTQSAAAGALPFQAWAKDMLSQYGSDNNTLTFFIDRGGNIPFSGVLPATYETEGDFAYQYTLPPTEEIVEFIRQTMIDYERLTNGTIQFREVNDDNLATISFYWSKEIEFSDGPLIITTLGVSANAQNDMGDKWRNVFYNDGGEAGSAGIALIKNTIVHEMGHTVGFSHPYDNASDLSNVNAGKGSNTLYNYTDSIMSYNRRKPADYELTASDKNAYRDIWQSFSGSVDRASNSGKSLRKGEVYGETTTINGGNPTQLGDLSDPNRDYITGSGLNDWYVGDQSDDTWHGFQGNDTYVYKGGFDFASGGQGMDTFQIAPFGENGYLTINDFTPGEDRLVFQSGENYTIFAFGGATFVLGSHTDKVVFLKGEFTEQQLLGTPEMKWFSLSN